MEMSPVKEGKKAMFKDERTQFYCSMVDFNKKLEFKEKDELMTGRQRLSKYD